MDDILEGTQATPRVLVARTCAVDLPRGWHVVGTCLEAT